jgi:hypothetical protein
MSLRSLAKSIIGIVTIYSPLIRLLDGHRPVCGGKIESPMKMAAKQEGDDAPLPSHYFQAEDAQSQFLDLVFCNQ